MKYKVKKGTTVITHTKGASFDVRKFMPLDTEVDVTFGENDVWFSPDKISMNEDFSSTEKDTPSEWFDFMLYNFYGFKLPENKKMIDYIIVEQHNVEMVKEKKDVDSHISDSDKTLKKIQRQSGGFWGPGQGLPH